MIYAGVDYSMISPSLALYDTKSGEFSFKNTTIHYMTDRKMYLDPEFEFPNLHPYPTVETFTDQIDRYTQIKNWALKILKPVDRIIIEDYSMGSKGRVFGIAENTGILKYCLTQQKKQFLTIPPTVLKKFATGKGNADKEKMYAAFMEKTGLDIRLTKTEKVKSPISDIVDSFFFCDFGLHQTWI